ncbi:hypothetical protein [Subtercola vilae]|uniref:Uncharacterized protein n=1 Tax=Subtercola vilae TaxID=2056433 RepID=A0A4T2BS91_9MICO|nr:hypothetical protein [Subtercola vilae]TIH33782.1 hypothetical protein D4765_13950 [Subtercola vilae]
MIGIIAGAAVLLAVGVGVWVAVAPPAPAGIIAGAATASPRASVTGAAANGCVGGTAITVDQLLAEQARKDLTPLGAVTFFGAWLQYISLPGPAPANDYYHVLAATTVEPFTSTMVTFVPKYAAPGGQYNGANKRVSLDGAVYYIESATPDAVVVTIAAPMYLNDKPDVADASNPGQVTTAAGTYTLKPTSDGWKFSDGTASARTMQDIYSVGTKFEGGC